MFAKLWDWAQKIYGRGAKLVVTAAIALVVLAIVSDAWSGSYLIEISPVPDDVVKIAGDKDKVGAALRDRIGSIVKASQRQAGVKPIVPEGSEPEISVAGATFSLSYVVELIRKAIGHGYVSISGDLTLPTEGEVLLGSPYCPNLSATSRPVKLVLRNSDEGGGPFFEAVGAYPEVLQCGALAALAQLEPLSAASRLGLDSSTAPAGLELAETAIAKSRQTEQQPRWRRAFGFESAVPRGELTRGQVYMDMGPDHFEEAVAAFNLANQEYKARHRGDKDWYAAIDELAAIALLKADYKNALELADKALALNPTYDSALYHKAQIFDFRSRQVLRDITSTDTCEALADLEVARNAYTKLLESHPDFAVANVQFGIMALQQLAYWRQNKTSGCAARDKNLSESARKALFVNLENEMELRFSLGLAVDLNLSDGWFQWGIALYQMQDPAFLAIRDLDAHGRASLLHAAISKYENALSVKPKDPYIWELEGNAWVALASLPEACPNQTCSEGAKRAYCQSLAVNDGNDALLRDVRLRLAQSKLSETDCAPRP